MAHYSSEHVHQKNTQMHKVFLLVFAAIIFHAVFRTVRISGVVDFGVLRFFTVLSNIFLGLAFTARVVFYRRYHEMLRQLMFGAMVAILVTCVVYNFVLVPLASAPIFFVGYENFVTHYLSLFFAVVNYVFFEDKKQFRYKYVLTAMIFPLGYWLVFAMPISDFYPYFFMDPTQIGWGMAIFWFAAFLVVFAGVAVGWVRMDNASRGGAIIRYVIIAVLCIVTFFSGFFFFIIAGLTWLFDDRPRTIPREEPFAIENPVDMPEAGIHVEPGISLYINLRGNGFSFMLHDGSDVFVMPVICNCNFCYYLVYEIADEEDETWLRIGDKLHRRRIGWQKNSRGCDGWITVLVPDMEGYVFYRVVIVYDEMPWFVFITADEGNEHRWNRGWLPLSTLAERIYMNGVLLE